MTSEARRPENVDPTLWQQCLAMPKVELHRHLEGAIRMTTLTEHLPGAEVPEIAALLAKHGGDRTAAAREWFCITTPVASLGECMDRFTRIPACFTSLETIERIAFECVEDCALENVRVLEIRYSPGYIAIGHADLTIGDIHKSVARGVARAQDAYPTIVVGLIGILDRFVTDAQAMETAQFFIAHAGGADGFVGIDLANDELKYHDKIFPEAFAAAYKAGLKITIHAGEAYHERSPEWVLRAVEQQHAVRIGHGIHVVHDSSVVAKVRDAGIIFEVCPSSNVLCNAVASIAEHPIKAMIESGLLVTLSTDDPGMFCLNITGEIVVAIRDCGLTMAQVEAAQQIAFDASFIPLERRRAVWPAAVGAAASGTLA
eukprot:c8022_g1_i1.p2 GENE.c8022_g1_i1~~c8022_g1_i1.p2  ORF type:complete len:380 (+),score=79.83 c8022_g1_i1:23-1141(+)